MDQKELQQQIATFFTKLPPKAQAFFSGMSWLEVLKRISQDYYLNQQQIEALSTETTLVLLGVLHLDEYKINLTNELNVSKEILEKIMSELDNSILKDISLELTATFEANINQLEIKETDTRFKQLPQEIQNAIGEANYRESLYKVLKESGLNIEQMGKIEEAIVSVLLGNLDTEKFEQTLKDKLDLTQEKTTPIVNIINELVFKKIRNKVLSINRDEKDLITEKEDEIMKSAGIEINRSEKETTNSIPVVPKLLDSVRTPVIRTEHSLMNVSKTNSPVNGGVKMTVPTPTPKAPPIAPSRIMSDIKPTSSNTAKVSPSYSMGKDPYRLSPNE